MTDAAMGHFRTIEISDARFEQDGLRQVTVKSAALGARADITIFVPPGPENRHDVPLVLLLHGVYGSHWAWTQKAGVHRTARRLIESGDIEPMVLAMPSDGLWGDGSGYIAHPRQDFEAWIVREVPAAVALAAPQIEGDGKMFIAGLSMGGFGALRLGAKYPHRFRGISGHSSITHFDQMAHFVEEGLHRYGAAPEDKSVLETVIRHRAELPPLRFDCGTDDPLIEHNRELHRQLIAAEVPHHYQEFAGGHEWLYWEEHITDSLLFFQRIAAGDVSGRALR